MSKEHPAGRAPDNRERLREIERRLRQALDPKRLEVIDDSHKHVGHPGARDGRGHFTVVIDSEAFRDRSPVERHRIVYRALGEMMQTDIHALVIRAGVPD